MKNSLARRSLRALALGLAVSALSNYVATATPYATSLTNNAGTVSFRLNQTTATNDTVMVISGGGTVTNYLQLPSGDPTQVITNGLIVTNLGIAAGNFKVRIIHTGSGVISTNSPRISMPTIRGIAANRNPASPYFGWIYVANSTLNVRGKGLFAFSSDLSDILNQGNTALTGGYTFSSTTSFAPYKIYMVQAGTGLPGAPDDSLLVADDGEGASANLVILDPLLSTSSTMFPVSTSTDPPVGANNHGSVAGGIIVGTGASRKLYTTDEDYQQNTSSTSATELNSIWEYDIGNSTLPYSAAPNRIIASPYLTGFQGQNQGLHYYGFGGHHYMYYNQRRSNPPQYSLYITDLDNLPDPSTYGNNGNISGYPNIWASQDESHAEGYSDDLLRDMMQFDISADGRYMVGIVAASSGTITAPDNTTFSFGANSIILIPITNGIPNLPARQVYSPGGAANGRDVAFDAANNVYYGSSGIAAFQALDIGETTDTTTDSAGTFSIAEPSTQVSIAATTPVTKRGSGNLGVFTFTRTPDNLSSPATVIYAISGTAVNGTDYTRITNRITFAAGQTTTNLNISPLAGTIPQPTLAVKLTVLAGGAYSVGFPSFDSVYIADDKTPQLQIVGLSTNIYQGTTNDYAALRVRRLGDTNVSLTINAGDFTMGGTAVSNVDYYLTGLPWSVNAGDVDITNLMIHPGLSGSTAVGSRTINVTLLAGTGYTITNNTAATTLQLKGQKPGTVLFSDDFENTGTSMANWNVLYQSYTNGGNGDYVVQFGYDYSVGDFTKNLPGLPPAPHGGGTKGLYMTVNKNAAVSAGVNAYVKNHTFGGSYALRFDLYLVRNSIGTAQSQVEDVLFGINHDGNHTNWFRNASPNGTSLPGSPTLSDGWFFDIGSDGSGGGGAPYDFAAWSAPTWTNTVSVIGPTNNIGLRANNRLQVYKLPPYNIGNNVLGNPTGGTPGNTILNGTPTWAEVEIAHIQTVNGADVVWKVNNTVVMAFTTSNSGSLEIGPGGSYAANSGTVMVGYCDPWDDVGNGTPGQGEGCAIIDNVSVVALNSPITITPSVAGTNLNLTFPTDAGVNYVIDCKTNLDDASWTSFSTNVGSGDSITVSVPLATPYNPSTPARFYRVHLQ
jgi:hypothetical protein